MSVRGTALIADAEGDAPPRRRRLLVLAALVLLVSAGGGGWWWFAGAEAGPLGDGEVVVLEPLTTTTGNATLRHARISLGIVLVEGVDPIEVEPQIPLLKDALLREVAQMDADELRSQAGSDRLREQLTRDAVRIFSPELVRRVVLTELLVQ